MDSSVEIRKPRILIVDDEVAMVRSLELLLRPIGEVSKAYSVPEAQEALKEKIDCVVTDVSMPEASGLTLLEHVKKNSPETPVIVMTAYSSVPEAVEAIQLGAFEYLTKPFENQEMVSCVKKAVNRKGLIVGETRKIPEGWVCNSELMKEFLTKAEKLASSPAPLLLLGEKGVGKKRAARWIFENSRSKKTQFIFVDGKMRDEDSPLLALRPTKASVLYVEEVFSLSDRLQARLLELMQEGKAKILMGSSSSPSIQSAPGFREDLFEIIQTHVLRVPSLKERAEDLEALTMQILARIAESLRIKELRLDPPAFESLKKRAFIANVRELEQVLERAAIESKAGLITEHNLYEVKDDLAVQLPFSIPIEEGWKRLELLYRSLEKDLIERAIEKYPQTSNAQIASILGTTRRILELRMKAYQIRE